jgi:6-phosphogluconolactonase
MTRNIRKWFGAFLGLLICVTASIGAGGANPAPGTKSNAKGKKVMVYVGTYTGGKSKGIYYCELDTETGKLSEPRLAAEIVNPSFLAIHPNGKFLYAVNEVGEFNGKKAGSVTAYSIDAKTGDLTQLNQQSSVGTGPCHITTDKDGKHVFVANYGGGSVAALPVQADGKLGEATAFIQHDGKSVNPNRQGEPHAHSIYADPGNRFVVSADLGLDKILVYKYDAGKGTLTPNAPAFASVKPGAGPRHFAFTPDGKFAYVINELNSTVIAFEYDANTGTLKEIQTLTTLPDGFSGENYPADLQTHPSGKFLYGTNRGHDSVAAYAIDAKTGKLTSLGQTLTQGKNPRNFGIDPTGNFLIAANQESNSLVVFRINPESGALTPTGQTAEVGKPVCVKFLPLP